MSESAKLPEKVEDELTLAHHETCYCDQRGESIGAGCLDVRACIRDAIAEAIEEARCKHRVGDYHLSPEEYDAVLAEARRGGDRI